jgi:hypothetical protein
MNVLFSTGLIWQLLRSHFIYRVWQSFCLSVITWILYRAHRNQCPWKCWWTTPKTSTTRSDPMLVRSYSFPFSHCRQNWNFLNVGILFHCKKKNGVDSMLGFMSLLVDIIIPSMWWQKTKTSPLLMIVPEVNFSILLRRDQKATFYIPLHFTL